MNQTRIERVETFIIDLPMIRPHVLSMATVHRQSITIVRIHCTDGTVGVGEGTTIGGLAYGEESPEGIKLAIDTYFAPLLQGVDAARPALAMRRVAAAIVGNHFAKCAVETALLDAHGRRVGLSVSELLGGRLRERLPVLWTLASGDTARDIAEAEKMIAMRRHDTFKLKIGKRAMTLSITHIFLISYEYLLQMFREFEIEVVRVFFQHGAACRNQTCKGAAGLLLSLQRTRALGLIASWPTANSKMRDLGNDFGRCSISCRRALADRFRSRARTGRIRKRPTAFSTTIGLVKRRYWRGTSMQRVIGFLRPPDRFSFCTTRLSLLTTERMVGRLAI
jgi:hypothetical protein